MQRVDRSADAVLRNLFEHYMHDMAEWFRFDSREDGSYGYPTEQFWDHGCEVFLVYSALVPVGFAVVDSAGTRAPGPGARDLKEFFVVRSYRRDGVGQRFAHYVWDQFPGPWLVRVYLGNVPALPFWRRTVDAYTRGRYHESEQQSNGRDWRYFTFTSGATTAASASE
jgi:predicted acetyltransferase